MSSIVSSIAAIRTLALVGQAAAGKTSLTEALLVAAGAIGSPGSLERGSTVSDFDPLERKVGHSLNSALVHFQHADTRVHCIDTPGYPDFLGQAMTALEAALEGDEVVLLLSSGPLAGLADAAPRMLDARFG